MSKNGIDVSKWQGEIDFGKVKNTGVEFVIARSGWGKESPSQKDSTFEKNYLNCKKNGIPIGTYHYSYADSINDAKLEAKFCLKNISGKQLEYPVVYDIEDRTMLSLTTRARTDLVKTFCDEIEKNGYYAMFYCNLNWLKNYLYQDELTKDYDLWLADWGVSKPGVECGIWQTSDSGKFDGISGNVDTDVGYKDYPKIIKNKGLNGFLVNSEDSSNSVEEGELSPACETYTVLKGDTLWDISQKKLKSGARWKEISTLNGIVGDKIYVGEVLKIPR